MYVARIHHHSSLKVPYIILCYNNLSQVGIRGLSFTRFASVSISLKTRGTKKIRRHFLHRFPNVKNIVPTMFPAIFCDGFAIQNSSFDSFGASPFSQSCMYELAQIRSIFCTTQTKSPTRELVKSNKCSCHLHLS